MMLAVDPRHTDRTRLVLIEGGQVVATNDVADRNSVFAELVGLLARHGGPAVLESIGVVVGGGRFSGVRQAVVLARTIAFCLKVPAVGLVWAGLEPSSAECRKRGTTLRHANYAAPPNITLPRKTPAGRYRR